MVDNGTWTSFSVSSAMYPKMVLLCEPLFLKVWVDVKFCKLSDRLLFRCHSHKKLEFSNHNFVQFDGYKLICFSSLTVNWWRKIKLFVQATKDLAIWIDGSKWPRSFGFFHAERLVKLFLIRMHKRRHTVILNLQFFD